MTVSTLSRLAAVTLLALLAATPARADEAQLRKNLAERIPQLPKIDEVSKTPIPGLYEVRIGNDMIYTDEKGLTTSSRARSSTRARVPT
jgi:thiol:disulfide interchange protein DsbC